MAGTLERRLGAALLEKDWQLAVAESCTGGLLGAWLTSVPGCSQYFLGGIIAYNSRIKEELLGVPAGLLAEHGAVSRETALMMARGLKRLGADVGIAITGIAGPAGGTVEKPVGTTWIALVTPVIEYAVHQLAAGNRNEIRRQSVQAALELAVRVVAGEDEAADG